MQILIRSRHALDTSWLPYPNLSHLSQTTIRVLGGLLSAYHFSSGDSIYLERAVELANRMLPTFDTPSGLPLSMVNLALRKGVPDEAFPTLVSTAEAATLQLEFRYLSFLTGNDEYWEKAERVRGPHAMR